MLSKGQGLLSKLGRKALARLRKRMIAEPQVPRLRVGDSGNSNPPMVYYLCPDFDLPSGGIRTLYRHVDILNANGFPAAILHIRDGFRCTWFPHDTRIVYSGRVELQKHDVLVLPEVFGASLRDAPRGVRQVIFNQNAYLTFASATLESMDWSSGYLNNPDLAAVLVVSEDNSDYLRYAYPKLPVERVRQGLDSTVFFPPERPAGRRIAVMPRRYSRDLVQVVQLLRARGSLDGWELVLIDNCTPLQTADLMRSCSIYVAPSSQEGFGLPPVEAMTCGCLVVGFPGHGGREFLKPEWSMPVEQGDVVALAQALERAIQMHERDPAGFQALAKRGSEFARERYAPHVEREDVLRFFSSLRSVSLST